MTQLCSLDRTGKAEAPPSQLPPPLLPTFCPEGAQTSPPTPHIVRLGWGQGFFWLRDLEGFQLAGSRTEVT